MLAAATHLDFIGGKGGLALFVLTEDARDRRFLSGKLSPQCRDLPFERSPFALQRQLLPLGFFVKADAPYAYTAGPEGVEVLEFRACTSFDIKFRDTSVADWKPVGDAVREHGAGWPAARATVA